MSIEGLERVLAELEAEAEEWRVKHRATREVDYASGLLAAVVSVREAMPTPPAIVPTCGDCAHHEFLAVSYDDRGTHRCGHESSPPDGDLGVCADMRTPPRWCPLRRRSA